MFRSLRWRIAIYFIGLSSLVYISLTMLSLVFFRSSMQRAQDYELKVISSSLLRAVDVEGNKPVFKDWARIVQSDVSRSLVTIQLYDLKGSLLEAYGPKGYEHLINGLATVSREGANMRARTSPIINHGTTVGYMQLELPTSNIEAAAQQFGITMALIAPLVILGLAASSFFVSGKVSRPFEENMRMLRRFVEDAGHELNTPLSIAQARAEALERKLEREELHSSDINGIRNALIRMSTIVKDLMFLTEIEGPLSAQNPTHPVQLDELLNQLGAEYCSRFEEKKISFSYSIHANVVIAGYTDALTRLCSNLLENALKYTESGGSVRLTLDCRESHALIHVEDTGIGIPHESLPYVFDRFYRVDKSRSRASGGVGLGLSIVKAITEAHRGHVSVQSEPGKGSKFTIALPIA